METTLRASLIPPHPALRQMTHPASATTPATNSASIARPSRARNRLFAEQHHCAGRPYHSAPTPRVSRAMTGSLPSPARPLPRRALAHRLTDQQTMQQRHPPCPRRHHSENPLLTPAAWACPSLFLERELECRHILYRMRTLRALLHRVSAVRQWPLPELQPCSGTRLHFPHIPCQATRISLVRSHSV